MYIPSAPNVHDLNRITNINTCTPEVFGIERSIQLNCQTGWPMSWHNCQAQRRIQGGCPGCPDTRPFDMVPFFEKNIFSKRSPIRRIFPCPARPWTSVQNLTPLALSPAEKSAIVQSDKQTNSNRHIRTMPISMCGNDNQRLQLNTNSVGQHQLRTLTQIDL